jgi:hypothetical protein
VSGGVAVERELAATTTSSAPRSSAPDPALLDSFTLDELRDAIVDRRRRLIDELRAERVEVQKALRAVGGELEALTGERAMVATGLDALRSGSATSHSAPPSHSPPPPSTPSPRPGVRIGTLILKALAARYPAQATIGELATELGARISKPRPAVASGKALGGMKAGGLVHGWPAEEGGEESFVLTPKGLEKAGAG